MIYTETTSVSPWETNEPKELEASIRQLTMVSDLFNRRWAQKHFENFQFLLGNQSLKWSRVYDFAVDADFLGGDYNANRAQTNMTRTIVESLGSTLFSKMPELEFKESYETSDKSSRLKKVLKGLTRSYNERLNLFDELEYAAIANVLYSKVYAKITWNPLKGSKFKRKKQVPSQVPKMTTTIETDPVTGNQVVVPTPILGEDGNPIMIDSFEDVIGEDGKPVYEEVRNGDVEVEVLTPFEIRMDNTAKHFNKIKWIQHIRMLDYDEFVREFENQAGIDKKKLERIKGGTIAAPLVNLAFRHFLRSMFSSPPSLLEGGKATNSALTSIKNKVLVIEHYDRPTEGHSLNPTPWLAKGRRVIMANGFIIGQSTPQYRTNKVNGWHPFVESIWMPIPPSIESSGPMNDITNKNRQINLTDNLMQLAAQKEAGSILLVNKNSGINKDMITGEPGQTLYATDINNAIGYAQNNNPLPAFINQYREMQKDDIYEISGAQDAIRGERNIGTTSGYQARIYEERERRRLSRSITKFERFCAGIYEKIFACLQQNSIKLDESVVARIKATTTGVSEDDILSFLHGDLDYGVDITVKAHSMITKSKASQQALVQELVSNPVVAEKLAMDPAAFNEYLEFMEIPILRNGEALHFDRAKKENLFFFEAAVQNPKEPESIEAFSRNAPIVIWEDNDQIHIIEHKNDIIKNFDQYKKNPILFQIMQMHIAYHEQNMKAKGGMESPVVAQDAPNQVKRASQVSSQRPRDPQSINKEKMDFIQKQQAALSAEVSGKGQQSEAPSEQNV